MPFSFFVFRSNFGRVSCGKTMTEASGHSNVAMTDTEEETVANYYLTEYHLRLQDTPNLLQRRLEKANSTESILRGTKTTTSERLKSVGPWIQEKAGKTFTKKIFYRRLPILSWLPKYSTQDAIGDIVAGITVGLTVIPQSLAYSSIAGLPPQYGLYGSFLGCFIYIFFGSCKDVPMGPTAVIALLTFQTTGGLEPEYSILLCFLMGCVQLLMGILGLGFLIDFISGPVSSGFTSAAALMIITSQVKDILGINVTGSTFIHMWESLIRGMHGTQFWDCAMGFACIIVLLIMRLFTMVRIGPKDVEQQTTFQKFVNKTTWLIGTSRNAILVILCGVIGYMFSRNGATPGFKLIGYIPEGLPSFQLPPFSVTKNNVTVGFFDMCSTLGSGIIVVPLVGLLENIAICKAFSNGKAVDATQELLAIGLSNIGNSLVQAFPGSGSLSRSAVQNSSGVRTPLGSLYTGVLVVVALLFCTPYFYYIPKASLAAIIIAAVIFMVEVHVVIPIWNTKKSDLIPGIGTFVGCLVFPLQIGILIGIGINIVFILYHAARPKISIDRCTSNEGTEYLMVTPDRCLIFPSVDYVRNLVIKHSIKEAVPVVVDCSHIYGADYTAAKVIECITQDFSSRKQPLFFYNLKPSVVSIFNGLQPKDFVVYYDESQLDDLIRAYKKTQEERRITMNDIKISIDI